MKTKKNQRKNEKKNNKGITLIALVITIIVLLILAGVSIAMLTGKNGILTQAQRAKSETENAQKNEEGVLDNYAQYIEGSTNGGTLTTVTGNETSNTTVQDSLGNKVVVPAGFRIVNPGDNVEDGIIIEDVSHGATAGSQFVWIPVGTIQTTKGEKIIELKRYVFNDDGTINEKLTKTQPNEELRTKEGASRYYIEGLKNDNKLNTQAKDIEDFISKVKDTGGYYIGRYEARDGTTVVARTNSSSDENQITVKPDDYIYNFVTQAQAACLSQEMYKGEAFTSDLINSFAWDTAIVFIQTCSEKTSYSMQRSLNGSLLETGATNDKQCNIYDMASNCYEWTTESSNGTSKPCVYRGGYPYSESTYTAFHDITEDYSNTKTNSFRPILYLYH